jgi:D-alanyl-D-alanine carboxypeptidase (penicillin-binding protein 5/6)
LKYAYLAVLVTVLLSTAAGSASALSDRVIPAKAAVIMDSSGTVLYAKYPDAKLAPASTVKLITAMVVLDLLDPAQPVKISRNAAKTRTIPPKIHTDEELTVSGLLHLALMKSINSAAVALAEAAAGTEQEFVALMNRKARELGARRTLFTNASGLPRGTQYTTASDLVLVMKAALSYPLIKDILAKRTWIVTTSQGREIFLENSNDLLWQSSNIIGGKTGYTGDARHCFVCAIDTEKGPFYTAVLGARSRNSLWRSTLILSDIGTNPESVYQREKPRRKASRKSLKTQSVLVTSRDMKLP